MWTGGLITLGALIMAVRSAGADRSVLQAIAQRFGRVSWAAMAVAVITGILQVERLGFDWADEMLTLKLSLVVIAGGLAYLHQLTAKRSSPAVRGIMQATILVVSIGIFGAAVAL